MERNTQRAIRLGAPAACTAIAAVLLLVCSKSSPLYPLNDWMDANIFFTAGKAMMNGHVLYRDAFDHKGPLLYLLYGAAWLVDHGGFFGVYLLETVCFSAFLYISWRSVALFTGALHPVWMALPAAAILASKAMAHGGGAEELCLPLLACSLYRALEFLHHSDAEGRGVPSLPQRLVLAQGFLAGCILWIKFTMMGFYLAWVVLLTAIYLHRGWLRRLAESCGVYLVGMGLSLAPWICYFGLHGAVEDFFTAYFYDNLFLYASRSAPAGVGGQVYAIAQKLWWGCYDNPLVAALIFAGVVWGLWLWLARKRAAVALAIPVLGAGLAVTSFARGTYLVYYFMIFAVFAPLGLVPLVRLCRRLLPHGPRGRAEAAVPALGAAAALAFCLACGGNTSQLLRPRSELPQWQFAAYLRAHSAHPTLLNYGTLDGGFYTAANLLPPCQYFCVTNMPLPEQQAQQDALLAAGGVEFVTAVDGTLAARFPNYVLVLQSSYDSGEGLRTWYLYEKTEAA